MRLPWLATIIKKAARIERLEKGHVTQYYIQLIFLYALSSKEVTPF